MSIEREKKSMRIFGLGGTGLNLSREIYSWKDKSLDGFADIQFAFVDTSDSNFEKNIPDEEIYLLEGAIGSGKIRATHAEDFVSRIKEIVQTFTPCHLNVVIHSLNGG